MSTVVRLERTLTAPPAEVYRAWLEPDVLCRWLGPGAYSCARAEVDSQVGGRYRICHVDPDGADVGGAEGVFTELVADERSALRWHFVLTDRATPEAEESLLTITLAPGPAVDHAAHARPRPFGRAARRPPRDRRQHRGRLELRPRPTHHAGSLTCSSPRSTPC